MKYEKEMPARITISHNHLLSAMQDGDAVCCYADGTPVESDEAAISMNRQFLMALMEGIQMEGIQEDEGVIYPQLAHNPGIYGSQYRAMATYNRMEPSSRDDETTDLLADPESGPSQDQGPGM